MAADAHDIFEAQKQMSSLVRRMNDMTVAVGNARTVVEFNSERRKAALASATRVHLEAGQAYSTAESLARTSQGYVKAMKELRQEYEEAQNRLAEWEALRCAWESARSILSAHKETIKQI